MTEDDVLMPDLGVDEVPVVHAASDVATDFLMTLAAGKANILLLDKALTKGASDSAYLVSFIQQLENLVSVSAEGRDNAVSFLMGKYGVSMMTRLLLMLDYDRDWAQAASESLDRVRLGLTTYNFDRLRDMLGDMTVTAAVFAGHAHAKVTLSTAQKAILAEAFVARFSVSEADVIVGALGTLFENSERPMDFDLRVAIMRCYAKTEAGLVMLLAHTTKVFVSEVLLMGLSQKTLLAAGGAFDLACQWISGENGAAILKAMYVKKSEEAQVLIRMLGQANQTGRDALVSIGTGLIQAMTQRADQGLATKGLVRDIVLATEVIPTRGVLGDVLLQQTIVSGYLSGEALKETSLLNGLNNPVSLGGLLEKMVTASQAIRVSKDPASYGVIRNDSLSPVLEELVVEGYGVSTGRATRVVEAIVQRFQQRPVYDALVSFMRTELNFLLKNGAYTWVSAASEETVNPFLEALDQRIEEATKQVSARVIGSSGRKKHEKVDKKELRRPALSDALRDAYTAAFDAFNSGKMSFAELMQVLARSL